MLCITFHLFLWAALSSTDLRTNCSVSWVCFGQPGNPASCPILISPLASGPLPVQFVYQNLLSRNDQQQSHARAYLTNSGFKCEEFQVALNLNALKSKTPSGYWNPSSRILVFGKPHPYSPRSTVPCPLLVGDASVFLCLQCVRMWCVCICASMRMMCLWVWHVTGVCVCARVYYCEHKVGVSFSGT